MSLLPTRRESRADRAARIGVALAALAASRHYKLDDLTITVYDRVLAPIPTIYVERACRALEKAGEWMPKPAEIRAAAVACWRQDMTKQLQPGVYCPACSDTSWRRTGPRSVVPCDCRASNPNILLRRLGS